MISQSLTTVANSTNVFYFLAIIPHAKVFTSVLTKVLLGKFFSSAVSYGSPYTLQTVRIWAQVCHSNWWPALCLLFREATVVVEREAFLLFWVAFALYYRVILSCTENWIASGGRTEIVALRV